MNKKFGRIFLLLTLLLTLLNGCAPSQTSVPTLLPLATVLPATSTPALPGATLTPALSPTAAPSGKISLTDGLNRTIELSAPAATVVSLAPSNTEILFAIGAGKQVIGRDDLSDYPEEAKQIQSVAGSLGNYNLEEIATLKPDLVLAAEINTAEQVKSIENLGLKVYYLSNPKDMDGMFANLITVGKLTGHDQEAQTLVDSLKARVDRVQSKAAQQTSRPKVFYELDGTDPSKPWTPGKGTFVDLMISMAGGTNIADSAGEGWLQISSEDLLVQNPDIILLGDSAYGITVDSVLQRSGWEKINAVKNKTIYPFDDNLTSRPGPRLVDGLEAMVQIFHPDE